MKEYTISDKASLLEALRAINELSDAGLTLFVENDEHQIIGTLTDGDIRRCLLANGKLSDQVAVAMKREFSFFLDSERDNIEKFRAFKSRNINLVPVLNCEQRLVAIYDLRKMKSMLPVDAVLMAGGKGERLRPLTEKTPKPLLPVGDKAIIDNNVERLIDYGIKHISVTVNYLKEQIEDHFKEPQNGVLINCVREPKYLGTIGSVKFVDNFYNDSVLLMNSDLFTNINYEDFYLHFIENDADMSVAAVPYTVTIPYGIFDLRGRNIQGIQEKPVYNLYANAGIYLIKRKLLELIPNDTFFNATDFIDLLIQNKSKVIRFPLIGYWLDIGKHEEYKKAQELALHIK